VVVDDIDAVIDALEHFRQGGDLADQLILARAPRTGALPVLSFDQRFSACAGVDSSALKHELQGAHLRLEPMFLGATTPADRCWYLMDPDPGISDKDIDALLLRIRGINGVDAAYQKPRGEPP
jgi:hypothetical protein